MIDWKQVLERIAAMQEYFCGCKGNAAAGSDAEQRFGEYCATLFLLELLVKDKTAEEDDGK